MGMMVRRHHRVGLRGKKMALPQINHSNFNLELVSYRDGRTVYCKWKKENAHCCTYLHHSDMVQMPWEVRVVLFIYLEILIYCLISKYWVKSGLRLSYKVMKKRRREK